MKKQTAIGFSQLGRDYLVEQARVCADCGDWIPAYYLEQVWSKIDAVLTDDGELEGRYHYEISGNETNNGVPYIIQLKPEHFEWSNEE